MSSSVVPADRGCAIAADEGFGIAFVPGLLVLNDHEPGYDYWPLMKGLHRSRLGTGSYVRHLRLRPTTAWVPRASAAIASALVMEPPCCLPPAL